MLKNINMQFFNRSIFFYIKDKKNLQSVTKNKKFFHKKIEQALCLLYLGG